MKFPTYVNIAMQTIVDNGFDVYLVGGAVRDIILKKNPKDYDLATNACPEKISKIFLDKGYKVIIDIGRNYGVTTVIIEKVKLEITTFRIEKYGEDPHRPETVVFASKLEDDLKRRDFTINALAIDINNNIFDFFNGQNDMENKIIKTVGDANERFQEDALRMYRACRFASELGFTVDNILFDAIEKNSKKAKYLSMERVKTEIEKILVSELPSYGLTLLFKTKLIFESFTVKENGKKVYIPLLSYENDFKSTQLYEQFLFINKAPNDIKIRWAAFIFILYEFYLQNTNINSFAEKILKIFNYNAKFREKIIWLLLNYKKSFDYFNCLENDVNLWLVKEAKNSLFKNNNDFYECFTTLFKINIAQINEDQIHEFSLFIKILLEKIKEMPIHTSDLDLSGTEALEYLEKKQVGDFLKAVLRKVQSGEVKNEKKYILQFLKEHYV